MKTNVPILVCGNAGTVGGDLLRRRDITTYWALTIAECVAVMKRVGPRVCIVREEHAEALLKAKPSTSSTAILVLMREEEWTGAEGLFAAGATALVHGGAPDRILEAVSELTGLAFAQYPRVLYQTAVEIQVAGRDAQFLETVNLSASGVCVRGLDAVSLGLGAKVSFPLMEPPLETPALVVRCFEEKGKPMAGLAFTELKGEERARLIALVEQELAAHAGSAVTIDVSEIEELELEDKRRPSEVAVAELREMLRGVHHESMRETMREAAIQSMKKDSIVKLESKLTDAERKTMLGEPAPAWAEPALQARLQIHLDRRDSGQPSEKTVQETLVLCRNMGDAIASDDHDSMVEVTATRAGLLREIYAEPARVRHGAKPVAADKKAKKRSASGGRSTRA